MFLLNPSGVWLMGSFTSPQWQDGRIQMFEHPNYPGVYSTSVMVEGPADIQYKFSNGEPFRNCHFKMEKVMISKQMDVEQVME